MLLATAMLGLTACEARDEIVRKLENQQPVTAEDAKAAYSPRLVEHRQVYSNDQPGSLIHMYLTVTKDNLTASPPVTWSQLNEIKLAKDNTPDREMNVIIQEGSEKGPESGYFGSGANKANASIRLRGKTTLGASQKSYKIELGGSAGEWRDQRTINLVKHAYDFSRLRNKLSFDLIKTIPDITSLRTQFVQLHVRDLTSGAGDQGFVDYGLYTQVEQPNKSFLRTHGLDPYAHLYKPVFFEFYRYPEQLKKVDDPAYDKASFETIMETKGDKDHTKLLRMLDDVNDMTQDIDKVFEKHFDKDNFYTWMAVNILMDNVDTNSQNYYLYSPLNSEKWYFLPWDYDGAWGIYETPGSPDEYRMPWRQGLSTYWNNVLHNRLFKNPQNVELLTAKMKEISAYINEENTRKQIEIYKPITNLFVHRPPDIGYMNRPIEYYQMELERLPKLPALSEQRYMTSLQTPMPFYMGVPVRVDGQLEFVWDPSYDLQGDDLTYRIQIARDPGMEKLIAEQTELKSTRVKLPDPGPGEYYWKVVVEDIQGNEMTSFDRYVDEDRDRFQGVRQFYLE